MQLSQTQPAEAASGWFAAKVAPNAVSVCFLSISWMHPDCAAGLEISKHRILRERVECEPVLAKQWLV